MAAEKLDGKRTSAALLSEIESRVKVLRGAGVYPCLATVLVGNNPASRTYVQMKANKCASVGIESLRVELDESTTTEDLVAVISKLSEDASVDGILLQHPVPQHIDERAAFEAIAAAKDVDGVTQASFAAMALGLPGYHSCTPGGILRLLDAYRIEIEGKHAVVVGRSAILGLPMGMLLLGRNATVTYCHSRTRDLAEQVRRADIVVAAIGIPELIRGEWIKPGAVVVDAGYNEGSIGDVDQDGADDVATWLTPVPGGVGPMTIALLLAQTVQSAELRHPGP
jgi:methylenetetrahydrofolate dehydrogenase (NADP+)/methenyltetrahydrofolate cyclohydrolase